MAVAKAISSTPLFSSLRPVVRCVVSLCGFCVFFMFVVGSFQSVSWKFDF